MTWQSSWTVTFFCWDQIVVWKSWQLYLSNLVLFIMVNFIYTVYLYLLLFHCDNLIPYRWQCLFAGLDYWTGLLDWTTGLSRIKLVPDIFTVDPDIRIQYPIILLVWSRHMEYGPWPWPADGEEGAFVEWVPLLIEPSPWIRVSLVLRSYIDLHCWEQPRVHR